MDPAGAFRVVSAANAVLAGELLDGALPVLIVNQFPADVFDDDQYPERPRGSGRRWFLGVLLVMAVGGGLLAWYNAKPETSPVPNLAGMEDGVALNQIAGTFNGVLVQESSEVVPVGVVIRTEWLSVDQVGE